MDVRAFVKQKWEATKLLCMKYDVHVYLCKRETEKEKQKDRENEFMKERHR